MPYPSQIAFLVYDQIKLLDLSGALQIFSDARLPNDCPAYQCHMISSEGGMIATDTMVTLPSQAVATFQKQACQIDILVIVGGFGAYQAYQDRKIQQIIRDLSDSCRHIVAICTGSMLLAASGLLSGKRAATHWTNVDTMRHLFPDIQVEEDPIYIQQGRFWTSAGVTAGMDCCLAVIQTELGAEEMRRLAKNLVMYAVRPGGQAQFSSLLQRHQTDPHDRFQKLIYWLQDHLDHPLSVEDLATHLNMSLRSFHRHFTDYFGMPPAKYLQRLRLESAQSLLCQTDLTLSEIATRCGFRDSDHLRRVFQQYFGILPTDYRQHFGGNPSTGPALFG